MRFVPICSPFLDAIAAFASSIEAKRTKPYLPQSEVQHQCGRIAT